jgi:hypothetical protein
MLALNRLAAVAAVLGGVGQIAATATEPDVPDDPMGGMTVLADSAWFEANRALDVLTFLLVIFALAAFARTVGERGRPWAQTGLVFLAALGALGTAAVLTQLTLRFIATGWTDAAPDARAPQEVVYREVNEISSNLYAGAFLAYGIFLGLLGAGVLAGRARARWFGWALALAGLGLVSGTLGLIASDGAFLVVLAALGLVDVLLIVIGFALWRILEVTPARAPDAERFEGVEP